MLSPYSADSQINKALRLFVASTSGWIKTPREDEAMAGERLARPKTYFKGIIAPCFHEMSRISEEHLKDVWC